MGDRQSEWVASVDVVSWKAYPGKCLCELRSGHSRDGGFLRQSQNTEHKKGNDSHIPVTERPVWLENKNTRPGPPFWS